MPLDPLNRKLSLLGSLFAFVGIILGAIALGTDYWTSSNYETPNRALEMANGTILISGQTNQTWNVRKSMFFRCFYFYFFLFSRVYSIIVQIKIQHVNSILFAQHLFFVCWD